MTAQCSSESAKPVAWRVDGIRHGEPQVWFYWNSEWPAMHEEQGDKVTPLYAAPAQAVLTVEDVYANCQTTLIGFREELTEQNIKFICDQISRKVIASMSSTQRDDQ